MYRQRPQYCSTTSFICGTGKLQHNKCYTLYRRHHIGTTKQSVIWCTGKTTLLRDITCQLADKFGRLVLVVDSTEEIAGGGNIPHACIGSARCMLSSTQQSKHEVLQEAVANHGPEV